LPQRTASSVVLKKQAAMAASKTIGISNGINKNQILDEYTEVCLGKEGISYQVTSSSKGEPTNKHRPTCLQLQNEAKPEPSVSS
jgi:hypothetical protein